MTLLVVIGSCKNKVVENTTVENTTGTKPGVSGKIGFIFSIYRSATELLIT